jgi:hypothetical protein
METAQSIPLILTPEYSIPIGLGRKLSIECHQWPSGQKNLSIGKYKVGRSIRILLVIIYQIQSKNWRYPKYLPSICVPQGAYKFVAAIDEVISKLPMEEPKHPGLPKLIGFSIGLMFLLEPFIFLSKKATNHH